MNAYSTSQRILIKLLALSIALTLISCTPYGILPSASRIEREVRNAVPIGSTKDEALRYFERKGVEHSDGTYIMASVHHIRGTAPLAKKSLLIKIYYDDNGSVTGYDFNVYYTSF